MNHDVAGALAAGAAVFIAILGFWTMDLWLLIVAGLMGAVAFMGFTGKDAE